MIIVRVELHALGTGLVTELARMHIQNDGGTRSLAHYRVETFRGRTTAELDREIGQRSANVRNHAKQADDVWQLVGKALVATDYIRPAVRESRLPPIESEGGPPQGLTPDMVRLIIAARVVAFEDQGKEALKELDQASEAFASAVPWDDEPAAEGTPNA